MTIANPDQTEQCSLRATVRGLIARVLGLFAGTSDHSVARRGAATAFGIRVAGAAVAFLSQIVLARWMGRHEFGIYVYVWTWLLLLGSLVRSGCAPRRNVLFPNIRRRAIMRGCAATFSPAAGSWWRLRP